MSGNWRIEIGIKLLDRTTRSVRLTHAGMELLERSRHILNQIDDAAMAVQRSAEGQHGRLNIAFTDAASHHILPSILGEFRRLHPGIGFNINNDGTAGQVPKLVEGKYHFGFLRLPVHTRRLNTLTLAREGVVAVLPRSHPLASRVPLLLEDMAKEDFIRYSPVLGVDFQEHILSYCQRAGFTPQIAFEVPDTAAILALVAAGLGVAIVPDYVKHGSQTKVVYRSLPEIPRLVDTAVAWLPGDHPPAHQAFQRMIDVYLRNNPLD